MSQDPTTTSPSRVSGVWFALRMLEVRLRFVAVLVLLGLVIGYWETLSNYWDRWTRPSVAAAGAMASDTEYYCPMDPAVVRPGLEPNGSIPKCPICGMPLSLRKKGAPVELAPGVVGRVALSANRVRMAGIQTAEVGLRPLSREIRAVGSVAYDESRRSQIVSRFAGYVERLLVDKTYQAVQAGDPLAEIYSPELSAALQELRLASRVPGSNLASISREKVRLLGIEDREIDAMLESAVTDRVTVRSPQSGMVLRKTIQQGSTIESGQMLFEVVDLSRVWIEADIFERDIALIHVGQVATASVEAYPNRTFAATVGLIYPEVDPATRTNRVRFELDNSDASLRSGMYATVRITSPIQHLEPFQSMLVSARSPIQDPAQAIASQVVCPVTGARLGSMGEPISIRAGDQTLYICCQGCEKAVHQDPLKYISRIRTVSDDAVLAVPESAVIDTGEQQIVYVEREEGIYEGVLVQLGPRSEGFVSVISGLLPGDRVAAAGAFLIDAETRLNPAASASYFGASGGPSSASSTAASPTLANTAGSATEATDDPSQTPSLNYQTSRLTAEELAEIAALSPDEQKQAKLQVLCPVTLEPLGSMGTPMLVNVGDDSLFICCKGCLKKVTKNGESMLEMVRRWRESNEKSLTDQPSQAGGP